MIGQKRGTLLQNIVGALRDAGRFNKMFAGPHCGGRFRAARNLAIRPRKKNSALVRFIAFVGVTVGALHTLQGFSSDALFVVIGDQHSAYARTAQFVAQIDRIKTENPDTPIAVLIDGDTFEQGNVIARRSEGAIDLAMFSALSRRASTVLNLGNHEPEFADVAATVARVNATGVTVIGNLRDRSTGALFAPAATELHLGSIHVVIAGVTTDILAQYRAAVRPSLDLAAPEVWAREKFPELLAVAPVKIVLSHAGLRLDRAMLPFVPEGTLFAGAHDHTQFVEQLGRTWYFQSGSWNGHISIVKLTLNGGQPSWTIEQRPIRDNDPADPELARVIATTESRLLTPEDMKPIGFSKTAQTRAEAAAYVVHAVREKAGADAAFIGNTTFGDGLPQGVISQMALDACVRFDGAISVGQVTGAHLRRLLREANQGPETPFSERQGEFSFASGPEKIIDDRLYAIATNDWGVRNRERYFGAEEITFVEKPELRLKAVAAAALADDAKAK